MRKRTLLATAVLSSGATLLFPGCVPRALAPASPVAAPLPPSSPRQRATPDVAVGAAHVPSAPYVADIEAGFGSIRRFYRVLRRGERFRVEEFTSRAHGTPVRIAYHDGAD